VRLGHIKNPKWEDLDLQVLTTTNEAIPLEVLRAGHLLHATLTPKAEGADQIGFAGLAPCLPSIVGAVQSGMPASRVGLTPKDEIVAVNGKSVPCWQALADGIQKAKGGPVELTVRRQGKEIPVRVTPVERAIAGERRWIIGVMPRNEMLVRHLPWQLAIKTSLGDNLRSSLATFYVLEKILERRMSARSLSGPIGIAQISGEAYRAGIPDLLMLVSFISLQLGIFNLLPIPILDGGMILLLLIEGLMRRDLSLQVKERVVQAGMVILLLLLVFVMYNDILKTIRPY